MLLDRHLSRALRLKSLRNDLRSAPHSIQRGPSMASKQSQPRLAGWDSSVHTHTSLHRADVMCHVEATLGDSQQLSATS